jgi:hypothetical protein
LQPTSAGAEFNLGLALLARGDVGAAERAYRRGVALHKRQVPTNARQELDGALGDFALLPELADGPKDAAARIRLWLQTEQDRIVAG